MMPDKKNLYTFLLDFKGGTYISQVWARSPQESLFGWIKGEKYSVVQELAGIKSTDFKNYFGSENCVPVDQLESVWCVSFLAEDDLGIINIVGTTATIVPGDVP
ncbi:conserved hypothetical protein [Desulfatibacillum aliphaticivorans]|uniref:Uncharacterized protein n=1 Tax=Desulfatibacillum aliphaticivorans TaxID=218208 RepID=B8FA88_DESAL|nr:hypothetical protein [Desulfatibacillum aliphaticivorans]ACL03184.1 conserved hypothetical protein [Desulfatibacillum aliphaticivorans]